MPVVVDDGVVDDDGRAVSSPELMSHDNIMR